MRLGANPHPSSHTPFGEEFVKCCTSLFNEQTHFHSYKCNDSWQLITLCFFYPLVMLSGEFLLIWHNPTLKDSRMDWLDFCGQGQLPCDIIMICKNTCTRVCLFRPQNSSAPLHWATLFLGSCGTNPLWRLWETISLHETDQSKARVWMSYMDMRGHAPGVWGQPEPSSLHQQKL